MYTQQFVTRQLVYTQELFAQAVSELYAVMIYFMCNAHVYVCTIQPPLMARFASMADQTPPLETWKCFTTESGVPYVRRDGTRMQDAWCVLSWAMILTAIILAWGSPEGK